MSSTSDSPPLFPFDHIYTMDTTFVTLPPPYENVIDRPMPLVVEPPQQDPPRLKRGRSPSFLSSVRNLIPRPLKRSRSKASLDVPRSANKATFEDSSASASTSTSHTSSPTSPTSRHSHCCLHSGPCEVSCIEPTHEQARRKRQRLPSMIDYLTLEQLETVWIGQDTYKGTVDAPRTTMDIDFNVTAPFVEQRQRLQIRSGPPTPRRSHSSEHISTSRWYAGVGR